jgi:type I restriction enzyme S subunit
MSPLPSACWRTVALNDLQADVPRAITDGPFGSNLTSAHYTSSGPRVVRLQNIGDGEFHDTRAHISEEHFATLRNH